MTTVLRTQAETDKYLTAHVRIGECITITFAPTEHIDMSYWIAARECCDSCGHVNPGLRLDKDGHVTDKCVWCGDSIITTWGDAQTERWERNDRYNQRGPNGEILDDGPQVGPIRVVGGEDAHVEALMAQADAALIKFEDARGELPVGPWTGPPGFTPARDREREALAMEAK